MISVRQDKSLRNCFIPNESDVLVGRGKGVQNSPGNKKYRHYILQYVPEYRRCKCKLDRDLVMRKIINLVEASGGRFLRQRNPGSAKNTTSAWEVLSEEETVNKVKQAVKDMAHRRFRSKSRRVDHGPSPQPCDPYNSVSPQNAGPCVYQQLGSKNNPTLPSNDQRVSLTPHISQATMGLLQMRMGTDLLKATFNCSVERFHQGSVQQATRSSYGPPIRAVARGSEQQKGMKPTESPSIYGQAPVGPPLPRQPHYYNLYCADRVRLT